MSEQIPNCPQPETPIRERAWADGQIKHTPGPWLKLPAEVGRTYIRIRGTALGGRYKIANVIAPVYEGGSEREFGQTLANAHLIAAAPDLLDALQAILPFIPVTSADEGGASAYSANVRAADKVRAAIAKAAGAKP